MTYDEILHSEKDYLTSADIAGVLHCDPYKLTLQARTDPIKLGFPVVIVGKRVRYPRKAFIRFWEGMTK